MESEILIQNKAEVRRASLEDVPGIVELIERYRFKPDGSGFLLPVNKEGIETLVASESFFVAHDTRRVVGCSSIVEYGNEEFEEIAELRSLVVDNEYRGQGIGSLLVEECIDEAVKRAYSELYALTQMETYNNLFKGLGFELLDERPIQKLAEDCAKCPLHNNGCNEITIVYRFSR
ncbi:MAG: GNAT family N-acetyltransferase [Nanoarchaeota archaeon]